MPTVVVRLNRPSLDASSMYSREDGIVTTNRRTQPGTAAIQSPDLRLERGGERLECLFYSESEAAARLGIHRTTLRALALAGHAPVEPITVTEHRRVYRRVDILRLAGMEP